MVEARSCCNGVEPNGCVVNLTEKYKQKVWYTEDELNSFKINTRSLAGYLLTDQEEHHNNNNYVRNIFGLEKYLSVELK